MRIKSLEIHGFKSFGDRTALQFGTGITGVVGPNGCGKSNIVDAIRWCMGEMSAKHLRGRAMQDVIFAGTDTRGPLGMAEVTLTFHNDGNAPPQYAAFSEIGVTRRLHRDGSSEYLVNKIPARLRDITDLFLGTGVGTRAYSIIEQGRIGFIVSSRPEDRRTLIEEVAGITKFKARKKAAERRMEATQQNLLRVGDIVNELEKQLASLQRAAKKAERYKRVKDELRELDLQSAAQGWLRLDVAKKLQLNERLSLEERLAAGQRDLDTQETNLEADRLRLLEEEERLQREQKAAAEVDAKLAALERDLTHWRNQRQSTLERAAALLADAEASQAELSRARQALVESERDRAELELINSRDDGLLIAAQEAVSLAQTSLRALDARIEAQRKDGLEHIHAAAQARALEHNLGRQIEQLRQRLEACLREQEQAAAQERDILERAAALELKRAQSERELTDWRARIAADREQLAALDEEVDSSEAKLQAHKTTLSERRSRLQSLKEIARRLEGYSDGVRHLLDPTETEGDFRPALRALLSSVLRVPTAHEQAIEAVLGERLQYLVVNSADAAAQAIAHLKNNQAGRSGFVPMNVAGRKVTAPASGPGVLGRASDLVGAEAGYEEVVRALLGDVVLVDTLEDALRLGATSDAVLVSRDGEVRDPSGLLRGGSTDGAGLLAQQREVRELTGEVERLHEELSILEAAHDALEARRLQLEVDIQQLDKDIHAAELERVQLDKDLEASEERARRLAERRETLDLEAAQEREGIERLATEQKGANVAAATAEEQQRAVEAKVGELQAERLALATDLEAHTHKLTTHRVEKASRDEQIRANAELKSRLDEQVQSLSQRIERDRQTAADGEEQGAELLEQIQEGEKRGETIVADAQERHRRLSESRAAYEEDRSGIDERQKSLREQRRGGELVQEALNQLRLDLQRIELEQQRLCEQVSERYELDLVRNMGDYHLLPLLGAAEEERRQELERSLKNIGPVNLLAIDECAEVEQRFQFLVRQRDDLASALDSLQRAIRRINKASRERFLEAFEAVNEMFKKVFPRLFRGGEAHLQLVESEDVLEAGVEIIAQPPGKKLQSVGLLSGGEKALTATALVFAIFLIKPSPFCILDEVDAPLDEANVGRFNEMLREICKFSQFIVITHNKNTMSMADRLYGITMEEPGLSKVVSVDLDSSRRTRAA